MVRIGGAASVIQWYRQKEAMKRFGANLESISKYGLRPGTRHHEGGIVSNRKEERYGENVLRLYTNRPSS